MTRPELFIWFNSPPKVERGAYNHLAKVWGNSVSYVITAPLRQERIDLGWDDGEYGQAKLINALATTSPDDFVSTIIGQAPDAVHIFSGFSGTVGDYLNRVAALPNRPKIAVVTERPGAYGPFLKKTLRLVGMTTKQRLVRRRMLGKVDALLPLGGKGRSTFASYGWPESIIYPFMYCPDLVPASASAVTPVEPEAIVAPQEPLRFLYVGRFSRFTKGTNTLLKAFDRLVPSEWSLGLVGGYGDYQQEARRWISRHPNSTLFENYSSAQVSALMSHYDVCVVPSHFDGWNVVVNEAMNCGLAVIATDQAISDELVTTSGAGLVVRAHSARLLANAVQHAISHPTEVQIWRDRARAFSPRISPERVGDYLADVLDYSLLNAERARPVAPWF